MATNKTGESGLGGARGKLLLLAASILLTYAASETVATWLYLSGWLEPTTRRVHERTDPAGNIRSDSARGYRLSQVPARLVVVTSYGEVVARGTLRGNNHGFGDRHDFSTRRASAEELRFAVLGDSYTAEPFLEVDWPDRVEELLAGRRPKTVRLLNMAIDGGGLANWWSILHNWLAAQDIELDGVIFALASDDLDRRFFWWGEMEPGSSDAPGPFMYGGYHHTWDPRSRPSLGRGGEHVPAYDAKWPVVRPEQLDRLLAGAWLPSDIPRPFRLYVATTAARLLRELVAGAAHAGPRSSSALEELEMRERLIADMRRWTAERGLRALVMDLNSDDRGRRFASEVGADYLPCGFGFADPERRAEHRIPYEGHWNQRGSDAFARHVAEPLYRWATRGGER